MIACTSPAFTVSESPLRIGVPPMVAWRLSIMSMGLPVRRAVRPRIVLVGVGFAMRARGFLLVGDAHPHAGGDPREDVVDVLEDVGRLDPHHPHADRLEALVAAAGDRLGLVAFVDVDRHAEEVAVEVEDRRADHSVARELVTAEVRLGEALGENLVRLGRMPPQVARPLMQHVEPLLRNLPPAPALLEGGRFGCLAKLEGLAFGHLTRLTWTRPSIPSTSMSLPSITTFGR